MQSHHVGLMRIRAVLFSIFSLLITQQSVAAIVDLGSITRDTATGLEWLDLTETSDRSFLDISSKFDVGEEFAGWRYASESEVQTLWQNFGLAAGTTEVVFVTDTVQYNAFVTAVTTLGNVHSEAASIFDYGTVGITGTLIEGFSDAYLVRGMRHLARSNKTIVSVGTDGLFETTSSIYHGSYLVREVPLPAASWLLLSAYTALFACRLKAEAHNI